MQNRKYTVLIISRGRKAPRSFRMSSGLIYLVSLLLIMAVAGVTSAVKITMDNNAVLLAELQHLNSVEEDNAKLLWDLDRLESEVVTLRTQMEELDKLGRQVRGLTADVLPSVASRSNTSRTFEVQEKLLSGDITDTVTYLQANVEKKEAELKSLIDDVIVYKDKLAKTPDYMPANGRITSPFGWRLSPFSKRRLFHNGIDIGAKYGTPVKSAAQGVVLQASYQAGYGNLIIIDHGIYTTYYAHLSRILVKAGSNVEKGEEIGKVGSTGNSTGPHLHFEVHKEGTPIDPQELL